MDADRAPEAPEAPEGSAVVLVCVALFFFFCPVALLRLAANMTQFCGMMKMQLSVWRIKYTPSSCSFLRRFLRSFLAAAAGADGKALGAGVPLSDLRRAPACSGPLPALKPTDRHTVLIRTDLMLTGEAPEPHPSPDQLQDRWDHTHVKLPCSTHNLFPTDRTTVQSRWDLIHKALSVPLRSSHDVKDAILKYNTGQAKRWDFSALHSYCKASEAQQMFGELFPAMAQLALRAPRLLTQPPPMRTLEHSLTE